MVVNIVKHQKLFLWIKRLLVEASAATNLDCISAPLVGFLIFSILQKSRLPLAIVTFLLTGSEGREAEKATWLSDSSNRKKWNERWQLFILNVGWNKGRPSLRKQHCRQDLLTFSTVRTTSSAGTSFTQPCMRLSRILSTMAINAGRRQWKGIN